MKGLLLFLGESFRYGGQGSRYVGVPESYQGQIDACKTHINFIKYSIEKYNIDIDVFISTYETQYTNDLLNIYNEHIIGTNIYNNQTRIGIKSLFHNSIKNINLYFIFELIYI